MKKIIVALFLPSLAIAAEPEKPFDWAAYNNYQSALVTNKVRTVRAMIDEKQADPNEWFAIGESALSLGGICKGNRRPLIRLLLNKKADVDKGWLLARRIINHHRIEQADPGDNLTTMDCLLRAKANIHAQEPRMKGTALGLACEWHNNAAVALMILHHHQSSNYLMVSFEKDPPNGTYFTTNFTFFASKQVIPVATLKDARRLKLTLDRANYLENQGLNCPLASVVIDEYLGDEQQPNAEEC